MRSLPDITAAQEQVQSYYHLERHMRNLKASNHELYSESQAAELLGITVARLHQLLDENIFNDGTPRPADLDFTTGELLLINFWHLAPRKPKRAGRLIQWPRRK